MSNQPSSAPDPSASTPGLVPGLSPDPGWSVVRAGVDGDREGADAAALEHGDGTIWVSGSPLPADPDAGPAVRAPGVFTGTGPESRLLPLPDCGRMELDVRDGMQVERILDLGAGVMHHRVRSGGVELSAVAFCSLARPGTFVLRAAGPHEWLELEPPLSLPSSAAGAGDARPCALSPSARLSESPSARTAGAPSGAASAGRDASAGGGRWFEDEDGASCVVHARGTPGGVIAAARERRAAGTLERLAVYVADAWEMPEAADARRRLDEAEQAGFSRLLDEHREAWRRRWDACDIVIDGDPELQRATRLSLFHLIGLVSSGGEAAVGARGPTSEAYRGHVFWDADIFVLPFFAATHPLSARAMLRYRARRLAAARAHAARHGRRGARFPWESAATGEEVTPETMLDFRGEVIPVVTGRHEEHITADVAWAAAYYLDWTGDEQFARGDGLALLVETARYWQSRVERDEDGSCHIRNVIGPDEYHEHVDDSAYTNVMARWNLRAAARHLERYGAAGHEQEIRDWLKTADALVDLYDPRTGLYEQFAGYHALEPLLASDLGHRPLNGRERLGYERISQSQIIKQTDVLMLHLNVPEETASGSLRPNVEFYEPRTAHESSLSPGSSAEALALAGRSDDAVHWLRETAYIDMPDLRTVAKPGLHTAAMGNTWRALALGFMGVRPTPRALRITPRLPAEWRSLELRVIYRGARVRIVAARDGVTVESDQEVDVALGDAPSATVTPGRAKILG